MSVAVFPRDSVLPWQTGVHEDLQFRRWLFHGFGVFLVLAILTPFLPVPDAPLAEQPRERKQYTRLVIEERTLPVAAPIVVEPPKPKPKPKVIPEPKAVEKTPPAAIKPKVIEKKPVPVVKDLVKEARDKAAKTGVLALADQLADMRQQVDTSQLKKSSLARGESQATKSERKLLAAKASGSTKGIAATQLSSDTAGVALAARETVRVASVESEYSGDATGAASGYYDETSGRSSESVRRVMDANKGAIFAIYNRALRADPSLAGKVLFQMVIEPSGQVSDISLVSSELADQALVRKILSRIKMINFGAEPSGQTSVNYSFDFLPY